MQARWLKHQWNRRAKVHNFPDPPHGGWFRAVCGYTAYHSHIFASTHTNYCLKCIKALKQTEGGGYE